jgi:hypothetical protein
MVCMMWMMVASDILMDWKGQQVLYNRNENRAPG